MTARKITATFPDGRVLRRRTPKAYTHAWRVCWRYGTNADGKPVLVTRAGHEAVLSTDAGSESGFASSYDLATKAAASLAKRIMAQPRYTLTGQDVVPVDPIPAANRG